MERWLRSGQGGVRGLISRTAAGGGRVFIVLPFSPRRHLNLFYMIQEVTEGSTHTIEDVCMDVRLLIDDKLGWAIMGESVTRDFDYWVASGRDSVAGIAMAASLPETGFEACSDGLLVTVRDVYVDDRREQRICRWPDGVISYDHPCPDWFIPMKWSPNPFEKDCAVK